MTQPFDFNATVKCTRVDLAAGYEIAQQTERPHWNAGDFFDKFAEKQCRRERHARAFSSRGRDARARTLAPTLLFGERAAAVRRRDVRLQKL